MANFYDRAMTGLLGEPQTYGGLLGPQESEQAQRDAQMAMAAALLEAGGWSSQPTNLGQALGRGITAGRQARQGSTDQALNAALLRKQIAAAQAKDPRTTFQKDYEYAKANGFKGSPEEWARVRQAGQTTPAAIQQYEYWKSLPTQQERDAYLTVQRNMQPYQIAEIGGGKQVFNRATAELKPVTTAEQEAAGAGTIESAKAGGKVTGEQTATAKIDLPRVEDNADQLLKTLDDFEKHPGFKYVFGWDSIAPTIPGSSQAGAIAYYDQIKGKNFLEAFNSLKGAGQITEIEGQKATDAIARLDRAQSEKDAKVALADLREVVEAGRARARKKAGNASAKPSGGAGQPMTFATEQEAEAAAAAGKIKAGDRIVVGGVSGKWQ